MPKKHLIGLINHQGCKKPSECTLGMETLCNNVSNLFEKIMHSRVTFKGMGNSF